MGKRRKLGNIKIMWIIIKRAKKNTLWFHFSIVIFIF